MQKWRWVYVQRKTTKIKLFSINVPKYFILLNKSLWTPVHFYTNEVHFCLHRFRENSELITRRPQTSSSCGLQAYCICSSAHKLFLVLAGKELTGKPKYTRHPRKEGNTTFF